VKKLQEVATNPIGSLPFFNQSASVDRGRDHNNRKEHNVARNLEQQLNQV